MKPMSLAGAALVAALTGCDATLPRSGAGADYAPWEAGLTLVYERQDLPGALRMDQRVQVRVESSKLQGGGHRVVLSSSSFRGVVTSTHLVRQGGFALMAGEEVASDLIPAGFPDRVTAWKVGAVSFRVVGRAQADLPGVKLPEGARVGVWVESEDATGARERIFYLPGIGEAERRQWRDGRWVSVLRLVSRGFTDPAPGRTPNVA